MPVYQAPDKQVTVTRKVGESNKGLHFKFRSASVDCDEKSDRWRSVAAADYDQTRVEDYRPPKKWGVMQEAMNERGVRLPKPFVGTTTNLATQTVTKEETAAMYTPPLRQAPSEIAMAKGSKFAASGGKKDSWIPLDMIRAEKERLRALKKPVVIHPPMIKVNMSSYTGHEPKSPKNQSGPFRPSAATTSGHANLEGLGLWASCSGSYTIQ